MCLEIYKGTWRAEEMGVDMIIFDCVYMYNILKNKDEL